MQSGTNTKNDTGTHLSSEEDEDDDEEEEELKPDCSRACSLDFPDQIPCTVSVILN